MHYILISLALILIHQAFLVLILGLAAAIGAILGGGSIGSILMFILGLGTLALPIGALAAMRRLGAEKRALEWTALPAIFAALILVMPVVPFIARGAALGALGDRAVPVAGLVGSHRDGWVRLTDGTLDLSAARKGCVTHGKGTKKSKECITAAPIRSGTSTLLACMEEPPAGGAPLEGWYTAAPDRAEGAAIGQWSSSEAPTGGCLRLGDRGSLVFWKMYVGLGLLGISELILFGGLFAGVLMGMASPKPGAASTPPAA